MRIDVDLSDRELVLRKDNTKSNKEFDQILLEADIVSGCDGYETPRGKYIAGKWIKDKTNPIHGSVPWSKDRWGNPYGPYFLKILDLKGRYTRYGIHGTRGPMSIFEKPPLPKAILEWFIDDEEANFLYCSHGCIRISNYKIGEMFRLTTPPSRSLSEKIYIYIKK